MLDDLAQGCKNYEGDNLSLTEVTDVLLSSTSHVDSSALPFNNSCFLVVTFSYDGLNMGEFFTERYV